MLLCNAMLQGKQAPCCLPFLVFPDLLLAFGARLHAAYSSFTLTHTALIFTDRMQGLILRPAGSG